MKKLILLAMVLVMAGSAYAATVTDNPTGALYPAHLRKAAKMNTENFKIPFIAAADTTDAALTYYWRVPTKCKVESLKMVINPALAAGDTVSTEHFRVWAIANQSATNGDTLWQDSSVVSRVPTITAGTVWSIKGGPDSTKNVLDAGKVIRFQIYKTGTPALTRYLNFQFDYVPVDW